MNPHEREATAHHEAGHAAMHLWLGVTFKSMSIIGDEEALGRVTSQRPKWFRPDLHWDRRFLPRFETEIQVLLAGPEAEKRFTGEYNNEAAASDIAKAFDYAGTVHYSEKALNAFYAWLQASVEEHFDSPMFVEMVQALANALLERPTISYRRARAIVGEAAPPVIRWR